MKRIRRLRDGESERLREAAGDFVVGHSLCDTLGSLDPCGVLALAFGEPGNEHLYPAWLDVMREVTGEPQADLVMDGVVWRWG